MKIKNAIFIVGIQKCGTGSLHNYICKQNDVGYTEIKEPHFLIHDSQYVEAHLTKYLKKIRCNKSNNLIDSSTSYFTSEQALKNINLFFENPRIIVIARDKGEKLRSSIQHIKKREKCFDKRDLEELSKELHTCKSWDHIRQIESQSMNCRNVDPSFFLNTIFLLNKERIGHDDTYWPFYYFSNLNYEKHINEWNEAFDQVLVVNLSDPKLTSKINYFLRKKSRFLDGSFENKNKTFTPSRLYKALYRILRIMRIILIFKIFEKYTGISVINHIKEKLNRNSDIKIELPKIVVEAR